jgi:hypothetical protein
MSPLTLAACLFLIAVALLLVSLPIMYYETIISIIAATISPSIRNRPYVLKTARVIDKFDESLAWPDPHWLQHERQGGVWGCVHGDLLHSYPDLSARQ